MNKYLVKITETSQKFVHVDARISRMHMKKLMRDGIAQILSSS